MVLWRKETNGSNLYVNLIPFNASDDRISEIMWKELSFSGAGIRRVKKDDSLAKEFRERGNDKFKMNQLIEAMELYNTSLQFATEGSINISLAYANRSMCFLRLNKYTECLADIELAIAANYPERLRRKLIERQTTCFFLMGTPNQTESSEKLRLDFDADDKFPFMANVLAIQCNDEFGRHIVSKSNIQVGKVVSIEKSLCFDASQFDGFCCKTCFKVLKNFIPCPKCSCVLFCDADCMQKNQVHQMTCGASYFHEEGHIRILETIWFAVTAFSSVDELMSFVEAALSCRDAFDFAKYSSVEQLKYHLFFNLPISPVQLSFERCFKMTNIVYTILLIPEMRQRFKTESKRRFLQHLIWHHFQVIEKNSSILYIPFKDKYIEFIFSFASSFKHSCTPNILFSRCGDEYIGYIVRPVKKGEQLLTSYIPVDATDEQISKYVDKYKIECKCSKCKPCFKQEDCIRMQSDVDYQFISKFDEKDMSNHVLRKILRGKCHKFLSKFGHLPWCKEIDLVIIKLERCMNDECNFLFIDP